MALHRIRGVGAKQQWPVYDYAGGKWIRWPEPYAKTAIMRTTRYWTSSDGRRSNDEDVILKHILENSDFEREYMMYRILTNSKIPYIGRVLDSGGIRQYFPDPHMWYFEGNQTLVLPLYASFPEVLSQASFMRYFGELLQFVAAMEANGYVHLDLRPENIVLDSFRDEIVVIDFEMSRVLRSDGYCLVTAAEDKVGGHPIIAPEMDYDLGEHGEHLCSSLCDVYSAGVTADLWRERLGDKAQALPKALTLLIASMTERERKDRISAGAAFKQFLKVEALLKVVPSSKKPTDIVLA